MLGPRVQCREQAPKMSKFRRLETVLHMPTERLPRCTPFSGARNARKMIRGDRSMTCEKGMKTLISGLARKGPVRLRGWRSQDPLRRGFETTG